jgi:hypothetical protein
VAENRQATLRAAPPTSLQIKSAGSHVRQSSPLISRWVDEFFDARCRTDSRADFAVKLRTFVSEEQLHRQLGSKGRRGSSRFDSRDDISNGPFRREAFTGPDPQTVGRFQKAADSVTSDNSEAKGWGIGLGFALGIVLAVLSLSEMPFLGRTRFEPARLNLPGRENRDDQARVERLERLADVSPREEAAEKPDGLNSRSNPLSAQPVAPTAASPTVQKLVSSIPVAPALLSPLVPEPRDIDEDPQTQFNHARFLIKAGLAPIAREPLRKVVKNAPGTPIAREAQHTLDTISRN